MPGSTTSKNELNDEEMLARAAEIGRTLTAAIGQRIVGQSEVVELLLVALLARGHALMVGVPGLAKTLLASTLSELLELQFGRVQFTPDLMPSDITGTDVLDEDPTTGRRKMQFLPGPLFANLVLADEINRTPPKTQAALLQAMQERRVTAGRTTHALPDPFLVVATRNPIEQEGTYPLPEAQRDRFLMELHLDYPSAAEEREVARITTGAPRQALKPVVTLAELLGVLELVPRIPVADSALDLAVQWTRRTRPTDSSAPASVKRYVRFGAGPRGSQSLISAAKALAALAGAPMVEVAHVKRVAVPVLRHRLVLSYRAEADGVNEAKVLSEVLA